MLPARILIADDHPVFLESLSLLIGKIAGFEVVGKMNNGQEVLAYLEHSSADLVLSDIQMPVMDGLELIGELRKRMPTVKVLILTMLEDVGTIKDALKAGAWGYIFKSASLEAFERALNTVSAGSRFYSDEAMRRLVEEGDVPGRSGGPGGNGGLSDRELDVVRMIAKELKTSEIASRLFISVNTVETHRKNIFQKTGVKNVVGLIQYARRNGIIQ